MRVLIVQSSKSLGAMWQQHIARQGATADLSLTGADAIARIEAGPYDVIVIDLLLKEGRAFSVAEIAAFRQPDASVIFVTRDRFFSDGSVFALSSNARAMVSPDTPLDDLAAIVEHYGGPVSPDREARRNPEPD